MTETLLSSISPQWQSLYEAMPSLELRHGHSYLCGRDLAEAHSQNNTQHIYPLHHLALLIVEGQDATSFLQGQLTVDVEAMKNSESLWAAHCDAKGRMHANFILHRLSDQKYALQMSRSVIDIARLALAKYAVFSKVDIIDVSNDFAGFGFNNAIPKKIDDAIHIASHTASGSVIPFTSHTYWLPMAEAEAYINDTINHSDYSLAGSIDWQKTLTLQGLGYIENQTSGTFIPQMLNMDAIDGISFTKGCYTGQEIIARMKYRGAIKRRCYLFHAKLNDDEEKAATKALIDSTLIQSAAPGQLLLNQAGDTIGEVVSSVYDQGQLLGLAVVKTPALDKSTDFYLNNSHTDLEKSLFKITLEPPPYAINNN